MDYSSSNNTSSSFATPTPTTPLFSLDPALLNTILQYFSDASSRQDERLDNVGADKMTPWKQEIDTIFKTHSLLNAPSSFVGYEITLRTNNNYSLIDNSDKPSPWHIHSKKTDPSQLKVADWIGLKEYAKDKGFVVTAGRESGHNPGSAHDVGKAIDVRVWDHTRTSVDSFLLNLFSHGVSVRDERVRPPNQRVWSGPHIHAETPKNGQAPRLHLSSQFNSSGVRVQQPDPAPNMPANDPPPTPSTGSDITLP